MSKSTRAPVLRAFQKIQACLGPDAGLVLVGGAVRDMLLGQESGDWDLASALAPVDAMARAKRVGLQVIPTGLQHGTVMFLVREDGAEFTFEHTTFRGDGPYLDARRPSEIRLGVALEEDLARRDFTINALALPAEAIGEPHWRTHLVDPFCGIEDLERGLIRAVGDPLMRFAEDGLRALRACRFASQLGFQVEASTLSAIPERLEVAAKVSVERVFVELTKLLRGKDPVRGLRILETTGLLDLWLPELRPLVGLGQDHHHRFDVWEHTLVAFQREPIGTAAMRWALLLHDTGKVASRTVDATGKIHFHAHEAASRLVAETALKRLRAGNQLIVKVLGIIRCHGEHPAMDWTDQAYRRLLKCLAENGVSIEEWAAFRMADLWGKGWGDDWPEHRSATQVRLEHVEEAKQRLLAWASQRPPIHVKDLALDGRALMACLGRPAGPWVGKLQNELLEAVLEDPALNEPRALAELARHWQLKNGETH